MENLQTKGCVYFFKHIGINAVKIGYSTNESPINRFESFKTYAPYGAEILGFIKTYDAKGLETLLHEKFLSFRVNGEWFEVDENQVRNVISFYSNIEDIKEKNEFEIAWAKKSDINQDETGEKKFFNKYSFEKNDIYFNKVVIQKKEMLSILTNDQLFLLMKKYNLSFKSHRIDTFNVKNGVKVFSK